MKKLLVVIALAAGFGWWSESETHVGGILADGGAVAVALSRLNGAGN